MAALVAAIRLHHRPEEALSPLAHLLYLAEYLSGEEEDLRRSSGSIRYVRQHPELRRQQADRVRRLKTKLASAGVPAMPTESHIVPVLVGDSALCSRVDAGFDERAERADAFAHVAALRRRQREALTWVNGLRDRRRADAQNAPTVRLG